MLRILPLCFHQVTHPDRTERSRMSRLHTERPRKWMVSGKKADFREIADRLGISVVLARLIRNRDVVGPEESAAFLSASEQLLHDPKLLPDAEIAASVILDHIRGGKRIRIVGDYDVDGICSSYILLSTFRALGASADVRLPHRMKDGYGISREIVETAAEEDVSLIVTCDNGIAASAPLKRAEELGITAVVTDHHEVPFEISEGTRRYLLPPAAAVVDPKRREADGSGYPFPEICGAAVARKLCTLLWEKADVGAMPPALSAELDAFCGLATVCDVMPLQDENRYMVRRGLEEAARTANPGLRALIEVNGLSGKQLTCYHAGFILGPCLNATGRLDSAEMALDLFCEKSGDEALRMAQELRDLNDSRKSLTREGVDRAMALIASEDYLRDRVLVLYLPGCHESLAGIIAGKVKEAFYRPVFVFTDASGDILKGSGRSIEGYHMYEALHACEDLLVRFGGHAMAAGLSIRRDRLDELRRTLNEQCTLDEDQLTEKLHIDMELPPGLITMGIAEEFSLLEPCGTGNPRPLFVTRNVRLEQLRILGRNRNVLRMRGRDSTSRPLDLLCFREEEELQTLLEEAGLSKAMADLRAGRGNVRIDMVYEPDIHEWNGTKGLQFIIRDWRISR